MKRVHKAEKVEEDLKRVLWVLYRLEEEFIDSLDEMGREYHQQDVYEDVQSVREEIEKRFYALKNL